VRARTEEDDQIQEQLNLVLEKVEELENEMGFCRDDVLWDSMYMDHGTKRKRMAQLIAMLTSNGLIRSAKPGYHKRARASALRY
jgi:enamine deaminase RidA (YjgF/YER057c/UK114 family)